MPDVNLAVFLDPLALALIGGGTVLATAMRGTARDFGNAFAALPRLFRGVPFDFAVARAEIIAAERLSKSKPVLTIDPTTPADRDVREALLAIADGASPDMVEQQFDSARADRLERHRAVEDFWAAAAEIAPAMGMIGTLFGLVRMFARMDDPAAIGSAMAVALLSTLYGALIANLIAGPIAARLRRLSDIEEHQRTALIPELRALALRQSPALARRSA